MDIFDQIIDLEDDTTDEMVDINNDSFSSDDSESDTESENENDVINQSNGTNQTNYQNNDKVIDFQFSKYSWCCPLL